MRRGFLSDAPPGQEDDNKLQVLLLGEGFTDLGRAGHGREAARGRSGISGGAVGCRGSGAVSAAERAVRLELDVGDGGSIGSSCCFLDLVEATGGHEIVRELLTSARVADTALLLIDAAAADGALEASLANDGRTRYHVLVAAALSIRHLVVLVGNLGRGRCSVAEQRYGEVLTQLQELFDFAGFSTSRVPVVPASAFALVGEAAESQHPQGEQEEPGSIGGSQVLAQTWYRGPSLATALGQAPLGGPDLQGRCLRMSVFEFYKLRGSEVVIVARVEAGTLREGAPLAISPGLVPLRARRLELDGRRVSTARPGDVVSLVGASVIDSSCNAVDESHVAAIYGVREGGDGVVGSDKKPQQSLLSRILSVGAVVSELDRDPAKQCRQFRALLTILAEPGGVAVRAGYRPTLDVHAAHVPCVVASLCWRRGRERLAAAVEAAADAAAAAAWGGVKREVVRGTGPTARDYVQLQQCLEIAPAALLIGDVAEVWLEPLAPVCLEVFSACPPLGRFGLRDQGVTLAAGVTVDVHFVADYEACFAD